MPFHRQAPTVIAVRDRAGDKRAEIKATMKALQNRERLRKDKLHYEARPHLADISSH